MPLDEAEALADEIWGHVRKSRQPLPTGPLEQIAFAIRERAAAAIGGIGGGWARTAKREGFDRAVEQQRHQIGAGRRKAGANMDARIKAAWIEERARLHQKYRGKVRVPFHTIDLEVAAKLCVGVRTVQRHRAKWCQKP